MKLKVYTEAPRKGTRARAAWDWVKNAHGAPAKLTVLRWGFAFETHPVRAILYTESGRMTWEDLERVPISENRTGQADGS